MRAPAGRRLLDEPAAAASPPPPPSPQQQLAVLPSSALPADESGTSSETTAPGTVEMKIINGDPAPATDYGFMVALLQNGRFFCGGTLLDATSVLTGELAWGTARARVGQLVAVPGSRQHAGGTPTSRRDMGVAGTLAAGTRCAPAGMPLPGPSHCNRPRSFVFVIPSLQRRTAWSTRGWRRTPRASPSGAPTAPYMMLPACLPTQVRPAPPPARPALHHHARPSRAGRSTPARPAAAPQTTHPRPPPRRRPCPAPPPARTEVPATSAWRARAVSAPPRLLISTPAPAPRTCPRPPAPAGYSPDTIPRDNLDLTFEGELHDLAVLKLAAEVPAVEAVALPNATSPLPAGQALLVAGWGTTESGQASTVLK